MTEVLFSIAKDFSPHPGPRLAKQGSHSGESLRRKLLRVLDTSNATVVVDLDGTKGIGSSFLDEAFGGLIRCENRSKDDILRRLQFRSRVDPSYIETILDSITKAESEKSRAN